MIMTKKGSFIPKVCFSSPGQAMKMVDTFVPIISRTDDWISLSVILLMWPFRHFLSQIWSGWLPILYRMERNPLWNVFLNIASKSGFVPTRMMSFESLTDVTDTNCALLETGEKFE